MLAQVQQQLMSVFQHGKPFCGWIISLPNVIFSWPTIILTVTPYATVIFLILVEGGWHPIAVNNEKHVYNRPIE
jgi:hypothetical protein